MKTLQEIENTLGNHKHDLFARYPIKSLAIFGSYARREQKEESDLANELESLIGFRVDLVSRKGIKDKYLQSIHSDLIYV